MEPSSDFTLAAEPAAISRPSLPRNLGFWLLAMVLGSFLVLLTPVLTGNIGAARSNLNYRAFFSTLTLLPTGLSLAALPLLLPLIPWALTAPTVGMRWLRVFTLQSLSLGELTALGYALAGGSKGFGSVAPLAGTIYFLGGLLAALVVYWPWLRRPQ